MSDFDVGKDISQGDVVLGLGYEAT